MKERPGMFAVTVLLEVDGRHLPEFMAEMKKQARNSLEREKGCRRFDICVDAQAPCRVFLYEIYNDRAAFKAHLRTDHFWEFDRRVNDWLVSRKLECWERQESDGRKK
jgi:(4S)-4-hydroxy-5-phosphonooxypentane-2,3-dione isomerase